MIIGDLDLGGRPAHLNPRAGMVLGNAHVLGSRTIAWAEGGDLSKLDVSFWISAWQPRGGQPANSVQANRYLRMQLKQLALSPDLQPVYIQWAASADPTFPSRTDPDDGWYFIDSLTWDPETYNQAGAIEARLTVTQVAPTAPSSLAAWYSGAALGSTYSQAATPLIAYPIGSTQQPAAALSRTGAEGAIPCSILPLSGGANPAPFVRPATIAGLYSGQCRVYDTLSTGTYPVPISGGFVNGNWLEIKGAQHDINGDLVVTNGLLLLLYQVGQVGVPLVYFWNTSLASPAWQQAGIIQYLDNVPNGATLREINVEKVAAEEVRIRARMSTSAGNWAEFRQKLQRGCQHVYCEFSPLTQANTFGGFMQWITAQNQKILWADTGVVDAVVQLSTGLPAGSLGGWCGAFGQTANGPILGFLYQNPPSGSQGASTGSPNFLYPGDSSGPAQGSFRLYGFFVVPFVNAPNLQAEAEGGALGTGWTSVADATASAGNAAKVASGTVNGNADVFGVSWVPPAGQYDVWFRVKVTATAGAVPEMRIGPWDATSAAFVTSRDLQASQASTSYVWLRGNITGPITPTAGHNMQFRAVTVNTLGTDWFVDEAVLVPRQSATLGLGNFPGDVFSQFAFDRIVSWARG